METPRLCFVAVAKRPALEAAHDIPERRVYKKIVGDDDSVSRQMHAAKQY
jgi:hypothetical protein